MAYSRQPHKTPHKAEKPWVTAGSAGKVKPQVSGPFAQNPRSANRADLPSHGNSHVTVQAEAGSIRRPSWDRVPEALVGRQRRCDAFGDSWAAAVESF